jgi:hypothetical protein
MTTFTTEDRLLAAAEIHSDKGYQTAPLEKATEFARTRQEQETQAILNMAKTIERMEKQLADAKKRIIELEDLLSNK